MRRSPDSADGLGHPRRQLAHLVSRTYTGGKTESVYRLQPIGVARPKRGQAAATLRCETCDAEVVVDIHSAGLTRRLRNDKLSTGVFVTAVGCAGTAVGVGMTLSNASGLPVLFLLIAFPLAIFALFWGIAAIMGSAAEDGVRLLTGTTEHSLREPGSTKETRSDG